MTQVVRYVLKNRGLTVHEMEFVDHLLKCRGVWKLDDHLAANLNGNNSSGAPLARLMGKLGCKVPGDLEAALQVLAAG